MAKSKKKNLKKVEYSDDTEILKLIKLIVIVTVVVLAFYGITMLVNTKEEEKTETSASIQYDEILIGNILNQNNDEYYVMIYDDEDYDVKLYNVYINKYKQKDEALRFYTSQLNNPINQKFKSEESNLKVKNIEDLKVKSSTLLKIKKGKITNYYEGEKMLEHLKEISKTED